MEYGDLNIESLIFTESLVFSLQFFNHSNNQEGVGDEEFNRVEMEWRLQALVLGIAKTTKGLSSIPELDRGAYFETQDKSTENLLTSLFIPGKY